MSADSTPVSVGPPLWLVAELTHRCPLHCAYCYNPINLTAAHQELRTEEWLHVLRQARELGAVQLGISGGEPLLRDDLDIVVAEAHRLGYYTNLITSGVGLNESRIAALKAAGLDHIQLSYQDSTRELNDFLSHTRTFDLKQRVAALIKALGFPMVINCVIHRLNIDHIGAIIDMADRLGAEYLELANAQYYSWAFLNRDQLLPSREQLASAAHITAQWRERTAGRMKIFTALPHGAHAAGADISKRARASNRRDLARVACFQSLSRHKLDEGAVRKLQRARQRFGRLPLPGVPPR